MRPTARRLQQPESALDKVDTSQLCYMYTVHPTTAALVHPLITVITVRDPLGAPVRVRVLGAYS